MYHRTNSSLVFSMRERNNLVLLAVMIASSLLILTPFYLANANRSVIVPTDVPMKDDQSGKPMSGDGSSMGEITRSRDNEQVSFTNVSPEVGLAGIIGDNLAWGDYNNDGFIDLLVRGNTTSGTLLFENRGAPNFDFIDVTQSKGIDCRGYGIWGDYDNDGNLDFFCAAREDSLWHNEGPPDYRFSNATSEEMYFKDNCPSEAAAWVDYDNDGFLDIFCTAWQKEDWQDYNWPNWGGVDHLWHNEGDGTFTDATVAAGVFRDNPAHAAMSIAVCDYNDDGWQDIYVGNYHLCPNYLWENQGDGTFVDKAGPEWADVDGDADYYQGSGPYYGHSAGCAWGDFDNDLDMDLWVSNLAHKDDERSGMNRGAFCDDAQLLDSSGWPDYHFQDIRSEVGIPVTPSGTIIYDNEGQGYWKDEDYFGCAWGDYDNDGDLDLWIPQVKTYSFWDWCYLWRNDGDRTFTDQAETLGIRVWSNTGAAWGDYDNDGDLDLITEGTYPFKGARELHLFRNDGNSNHWLQLELEGTDANRMAIGARVILESNGTFMSRIIGGDSGGHGFQNSPVVHFGLEGADSADRIEIRWPDRTRTELFHVEADRRLHITQSESIYIESVVTSPSELLEDDVIGLTITVSEPLSPDHRVEWDLDHDGIFEQETIPPGGREVVSPPFSFVDNGDYNISYRIFNEEDHTGISGTVNLTIMNRAPVAVVGNDIAAAEDSVVIFDAGGSYDTPSDMGRGLEYRWDLGDGESVDWSNSNRTNHVYPLMGNYTIRLEVRDDDGAVSADELTLTVLNVPPEATVPRHLEGYEDEPIEFSGSGEDTVNDTSGLSYFWDFGDGNHSLPGIMGDAMHTYERSGNYSAVLNVLDEDGGKGAANVTVWVRNVAPEITLVSDISVADEDLSVAFEMYGDDTDSDLAYLEYRLDFGDGTLSNWSSETSHSHSFNTSGEHVIRGWIRDDDGDTAYHDVRVEVFNVQPRADFKVLKEGRYVYEGQQVTLDASASSDTPSDAPSLNFTWKLPGGEKLYGKVVNVTLADVGRNRVTLDVRDDDMSTVSVSRNIDVGDVEPVAVFSFQPQRPKTGTMITFNASASILVASDEEATFEWNFGDGEKGLGIVAQHTYSKPGDYQVTLTIIDDEGTEIDERGRISIEEGERENDEEGLLGPEGAVGNILAISGTVLLLIIGTVVVIIIIRRKKGKGDVDDLAGEDDLGRSAPGETGQGPMVYDYPSLGRDDANTDMIAPPVQPPMAREIVISSLPSLEPLPEMEAEVTEPAPIAGDEAISAAPVASASEEGVTEAPNEVSPPARVVRRVKKVRRAKEA